MDLYEIWVDLAPGVRDVEFVEAIRGWLGFLQERGEIEGYRLSRRKFGFGPEALGEWHVTIEFKNLTQADDAFHTAASRHPEVEALHAEVYRRVTNYKSGLYRDFPDAPR
ncbi:MAG: hypothetical protein KIT11_03210 [Fimbriimonadaceae bacterium]|nr:hypothetical protein [Fimbriimonadaceae bacterium]QYK57094.1 MAG: hypothetical protein KF733_06315 [Fimbriimonadaceae bacterium]